MLEPQQVEWEPVLRLRLDLDRVPAGDRAAAGALVLLTLSDLGAGRRRSAQAPRAVAAPVQIEALTIRNLSAAVAVDPTLHIPSGKTADLPAAVRDSLRSAWRAPGSPLDRPPSTRRRMASGNFSLGPNKSC